MKLGLNKQKKNRESEYVKLLEFLAALGAEGIERERETKKKKETGGVRLHTRYTPVTHSHTDRPVTLSDDAHAKNLPRRMVAIHRESQRIRKNSGICPLKSRKNPYKFVNIPKECRGIPHRNSFR